MIAPNHIATAGHCIYIKDENSNTAEWCDYIVVTPANRSAYPSQPYGMALSQTVEVGGYWYDSFDSTDDLGVVELDTSFDTGYLNLSAPSGDIWGWWFRGQGYPGDLQDMYLIGGNIIKNTAYQFVFNNTSERGMSGGPVLDGDQNIIGFITAHDTSNGNAVVLRLRDWHVNKFMSYR